MSIVSHRLTVVGAPWRELTFLELETDDGLVGLSEARMVNKTATLVACVGELYGRYVHGMDPFDTERLSWQVQRTEYGRVGEVTQTALSLFEMACWDLIGQRLGVPIWKLLGGGFRTRVPAYANGWYRAEREPRAIATLAEGVVARGYRAMKLDPFGAAVVHLSRSERRHSVAIVEAVRGAVGPDVALMIEFHGRFSPATAAAVAQDLEPFDPEWIEEPIPPENPAALERVRAATSVPIATGERVHELAGFRELFERGLVDIAQADITHFGGFSAMKRLAGWAAAYEVQLAPHNVCGPVGTAANVHLAVSTPNVAVLEHFNDFADPWVAGLVDEAPTVDAADGCFPCPERPGLGLTLNADACAQHPSSHARFDIFQPGWEQRRDHVIA